MSGEDSEVTFEDLEHLIQIGCTPAEAVDYLAVEKRGKSQQMWGLDRERAQPTISENIAKAKEHIESAQRREDLRKKYGASSYYTSHFCPFCLSEETREIEVNEGGVAMDCADCGEGWMV